MRKLLNRASGLGLFGGELDIQIGIKRAFEGYSGRASDTWEDQYTFKSNEIVNSLGKVIFPKIEMKSKPYETYEEFISRVEALL